MTATQVQSRKGTQAEIDAFTGANAEIVVNTSNNSVVVQNGSTAGGFEAMRADLANANAGSAALTTGSLTTGALTATTLTGNDTSLTGSSSGSTVLTLTSNALTDTPLMVFQRTGGAVAGKLAYEDTNTAMSFGTTTAHELKLLTNNTNRLEIDSSGNATFSGSVTIADDSDPTLLIRTATADQANSGKISFREASGGTTGVDLRYNGNTNKFIIDTTDVSNALTIARTSGNASFTANVGIGDSDPGYPLAIQADGIAMRLDGTANTTRSIFFRNTTTANPAQIYSDGSLKLYTEDADTTIGFMSASTKVGVGTMSPAAAKFSGSATGLLNVYGTMPVVAVTESDVSDSEIYMGITGGTGYIGKSGAGSLILSTGATSTATALTLDNSQNATFAGDVAVDKYLRLRTTDDQANQWYLYSHTDDTFRINYNGAGDDAITIDTSENVGIGVTAPNANSKLEVDGRVRIGAGSVALPALTGSGDYDTGVWWGGSDILGFSTAGAERMRLDSNGDLTIQRSTGAQLLLRRSDATVVDGENIGSILFYTNDPSDSCGALIQAKAKGTWSANNYPTSIIFYNDNGSGDLTNRMEIDKDGVVHTGGDLKPGADVIMQNGRGINFSATANSSGSMTSETLDFYEEGAWSPQLWGYGSTQLGTSVAQGQYTRIGNMCYAAFRIQVDDLNSVSASYMIVQNLPFAHPNDNYGWAGVVNYFSGLNYDVSGLTWDVSSTTTHVWLTAVIGTDGHGASATSYVGSSYMTSSTMLKGMIVYRVS